MPSARCLRYPRSERTGALRVRNSDAIPCKKTRMARVGWRCRYSRITYYDRGWGKELRGDAGTQGCLVASGEDQTRASAQKAEGRARRWNAIPCLANRVPTRLDLRGKLVLLRGWPVQRGGGYRQDRRVTAWLMRRNAVELHTPRPRVLLLGHQSYRVKGWSRWIMDDDNCKTTALPARGCPVRIVATRGDETECKWCERLQERPRGRVTARWVCIMTHVMREPVRTVADRVERYVRPTGRNGAKRGATQQRGRSQAHP